MRWMLGREHAHGAGRLREFTDGLGPGMVRNCDSQPQGPEHKAFLRGTSCCGVPRVCRSDRSPPDLAGEREIARRSGSVAGQPAGVAARVLRRLTLSTSARSRDCTRSTACLPSRPANTCCARSRWLRTRTMPPRCTRPQRPRASCSRTRRGRASSRGRARPVRHRVRGHRRGVTGAIGLFDPIYTI